MAPCTSLASLWCGPAAIPIGRQLVLAPHRRLPHVVAHQPALPPALPRAGHRDLPGDGGRPRPWLFFVSIVLHELGHPPSGPLKEGMKIEGHHPLAVRRRGEVSSACSPRRGPELADRRGGPASSPWPWRCCSGLLVHRGVSLWGCRCRCGACSNTWRRSTSLVVIFNLVGRRCRSTEGGSCGPSCGKRRAELPLGPPGPAGHPRGRRSASSWGVYGRLRPSPSARWRPASGWPSWASSSSMQPGAEASYGAVDGTLQRARVGRPDDAQPRWSSPPRPRPSTTCSCEWPARAAPLPAYPRRRPGRARRADLAAAGPARSARRTGRNRTVAEADDRPRGTGWRSCRRNTPMRQATRCHPGERRARSRHGGGTDRGPGVDPRRGKGFLQAPTSGPTTPRPRRRPPHGGWGVWAPLAGAGWLLGVPSGTPPVYVLSPGPASDVSHDMTITGVPARIPSAPLPAHDPCVPTSTAALCPTSSRCFSGPHRAMVTTRRRRPRSPSRDLMFEERPGSWPAAAAARARGISVTADGARGVQGHRQPRQGSPGGGQPEDR